MPDYSDFDPANLKPHFVDKAGKLKPGVTTRLYSSGAPTDANQLKPSLLLNPDGTLKPSIANAAGLKRSVGGSGGAVTPEPTEMAYSGETLTFGGEILTFTE